MTERLFVSGAAGVIGREIVPLLVARGYDVWAADLKPRPREFTPAVQYRQGDLNSLRIDEVERIRPTGFIHLAATFERSTETYEFWDENFWHNVRLSHHLMGLLRDSLDLRRVVFASSYLIYEPSLYQFDEPRDRARPLHESDPVQPRNLTGMAKLAHEIELKYLDGFRRDRFSSACARIYRGYGRGSRDVISRWIRMALAGEQLTVYRPEGLFDFIYARDTAEGLIRLFETRELTGIVNLGTGRARRVSEILEILRSHFPALSVVASDADIPFEASCADMDRYRGATGWIPPTGLDSAIREMIEYERAHLAAPEPKALRNVLVSSAARKVPLVKAVTDAARRLDGTIKVFAGDVDPAAHAGLVADGFLVLPRTQAENAVELRQLCIEHGIGIVLPTRDGELPFWADHRDFFAERGIEVVVSSPEAIRISLDKRAFGEYGRAHGLPIIPVVDEPTLDGRFVVKERFGAGSASIGLDLSADEAKRHAAELEDPIVQPFIRGEESSVDAWADRDGRIKGLVLRRRDQVVNGESRVTTTYRNPMLEAQCRHLLESLQLRGPVVAQVLHDEDGRCHVIELNARFGGASTAAIAAGLDIWFWTLYEAAGGDVAELPFHRIAGEVRQVRVPCDIHIHDHSF
jgi:carbamoyl-phosphate synthase large subunit